MTAQTGSIDVSYRNLGAFVGAILGLAAIGILYAVTSIPAVESVLLVRTFLSATPTEGPVQPLMVAVPPVSAAIGGWWVAPRALAGDRWSGTVMGAATYAVATLVGPFVAMLWEPAIDPFRLLAGTVSVAILAGIAVFPLLPVCSVFGIVWAVALRSATGVVPGLPASAPRPFSGLVILLS